MVYPDFVRGHTNLAASILLRGAYDHIRPFSNCFIGLAKVVLKGDGNMYPCFKVAALEEKDSCYGNIITDSWDKITLNSLYVHTETITSKCIPEQSGCEFGIFQNLVEDKIDLDTVDTTNISDDLFF